MQIGELLKNYRIKQGKNQKEFIGTTISQSYYSKVEQNLHRISTEDLLGLLSYNNISFKEFFSELEVDSYQEQLNKVNEIFEEITEVSFLEDSSKLIKEIRKKVIRLNIDPNLKEESLLLIDGFLELDKKDPATFDNDLRTRLKEKIFLMPEYDAYKLSIYANFIDLYDFESNRQIIKQIVKALNKKKIERQDEILFAIVLNVVKQGIEEKKYHKMASLIALGKKIKMVPEFFLYRELLTFYEEMIFYHSDKKEGHLRKCELVMASFELGGMGGFRKEIEEFFDKYKEQ